MATEALPRSQVTVKTTLTVGLTLLGLVAGVFLVIKAVDALVLAGMAMLLAVAIDHPVALLERHRWRRPLAVVLVVFTLLAIITGLGFLLIPTAIKQGQNL